jgi:4-azaleucine resistance transporter AzlC
MKQRSLFTLTLPVFLGYIPLGMTFGFLMVSKGIAWYIPMIFSVFVFAGAAQFLAVGLVVNQVPLIDTAIATALINMRHVFYGLSLFQFLPKTLLKKLYFIFGITDETYSLLTTSPEINQSNAWKIAALNHSYWVIGTIVGALFATLIPPIKGIEFSLTALFVILLIAQIQAMPDLKIIGMAIGAFVLAALLLPNYFLVCASALALVFLGIDYAIKQPAKEVV